MNVDEFISLTRSAPARALSVALYLHSGQVDKAGLPYVEHPLRVAHGFDFGSTLYLAAVLHDVVEDTEWSVLDVDRAFGEDVAALVDAVSGRPGESYEAFIGRVVAAGPDAARLKLADVEDNLLPSRWQGLNPSLARRYERARMRLRQAIP